MSADSGILNWSGQFKVAPSSTSSKLRGDKVTLPPSALEGLLAAAPVVSLQNGGPRALTSGFDPYNPYTYEAERQARELLVERQHQLPQPLTFRIVNPQNGRVMYAGIREFSSADDEVGLSPFLRYALGLNEETALPDEVLSNTEHDNGVETKVTIHAKQLPKGKYVRLRPLEAGYDPEDWKSLLERYLRDNFTTLTNGEILAIPGGRHESFRFLVDKFEPEGDGICIVDTDLEVDIEALSEEQARETLNKKLAKSQKAPGTPQGSSPGGNIVLGVETPGQVLVGDYVDYELKNWNKGQVLEFSLDTQDEEQDLDLLISPYSSRHRSKPRVEEHLMADLNSRASKRLRLTPTNVELEDVESIYISIHAYGEEDSTSTYPVPYTLKVVSTTPESLSENINNDTSIAPDEVICKNCRQHIPKRTLPLHEAFCYRNNVLCPHCRNVFLKTSVTWKNHWHCPHDESYGNTPSSKTKHDTIFHPQSPITCPNCDFSAESLPVLALHRTTTCPGKEILCQFCHLVVPQQGPEDPSFTDPEVLLSGLTPHELADGARTTECHLCGKIIRLRDMRTHLRFHDRDRLTRPIPRLCRNAICGRTIKEQDRAHVDKEEMGLCGECFGPLYSANYDPEGKALRRRIERRLLHQVMAGCGKPWCANESLCRTGKKNTTGIDQVVSAKDALPTVKLVMDALSDNSSNSNSGSGGGPQIKFCVDEGSQRRRIMGEMMAAEGAYDLQWCVKALEEAAHGDAGKAMEWLRDWAPRIGETLS